MKIALVQIKKSAAYYTCVSVNQIILWRNNALSPKRYRFDKLNVDEVANCDFINMMPYAVCSDVLNLYKTD
jgi:hypothetical protein